MKKLDEIKERCMEAIDEHKAIVAEHNNIADDFELEQGRAEFAEEILEIINGESN